jgi:hypothetical protein
MTFVIQRADMKPMQIPAPAAMEPSQPLLDLVPITPRADFFFQDLLLEGLENEQDDATLDTGPINSQKPEGIRPALDTSSCVPAHPPPAPTPAASSRRHSPPSSANDPRLAANHLWGEHNIFGGDSSPCTPSSSHPQSPFGVDDRTNGEQVPSAVKLKRTRADASRDERATPPAPHPLLPIEAVGKKNSKARRNAKKSKRQRTDTRREGRKAGVEAIRTPRDVAVKKHVLHAEEMGTAYAVKDIPTASTGYIARRDDDGGRVHSLDELLAEGFELVKWDGRGARPILDRNGVVIAALVGSPSDEGWQKVHEEAFELLQQNLPKCEFTEEDTNHRRGQFGVLNAGISFGGGQQVPGNLSHNDAQKEVLRELCESSSFTRLAGFASSALATWMPKIHRHYGQCLKTLVDHDDELVPNFDDSVWSAAAFNFGPRTVTAKHRDAANLPFGICSITALGKYDYIVGGHVVLWEVGLVVEFPPGSTILIPSAAISHSNTQISPHELRSSFTQYSAGGLFRWIDQGFRTQDKYFKSLSKAEQMKIPERNKARIAHGMSLFSTLTELRTQKK